MKQITRYIDSVKADITFTIGGNAQENSDIIDAAGPDDIWFHLDGHPSEHVVASIPDGTSLDKKQILKIATQGALLCKKYSKYASQKNLRIIYTRISDIIKTEKVGCVIALNQKTLII
uniref:NFACT RNA-binding domain-containing protein n=1 Tax=viral metagenome TaxID=1070528 RepID=A0A6C0L816_9ZZZZ